MPNICPVILAGGHGTRLWPLSTAERPKQFLPLPENRSLFQHSLERITAREFLPPVIVCHEQHQSIVTEQLKTSKVEPAVVILEPEAKNTAAAIALACHWIGANLPHDTISLVLPADQLLEPVAALQDAIDTTTQKANQNLCLFGLHPTEPSHLFGYIKTNRDKEKKEGEEREIRVVTGFEEKPNTQRAQELINNDNAYWNSGIFMAKNANMLKWFQQWQPQMLKQCSQSIRQGNQEAPYLHPCQHSLQDMPNLPFDKAVVEHGPTTNMPITVTPLECKWRDMGSWQAWYEHSKAQRDSVSITTRRWGNYQVLLQQPGYKVKLLTLNSGAFISLQKHQHRSEHWVIINGQAEVQLDKTKHTLQPTQEITVPAGQWHQLTNIGTSKLKVIETQIGDYLEEDDIERS